MKFKLFIVVLALLICIPFVVHASDDNKYADYLDHEQIMNDGTRYYDIKLDEIPIHFIFRHIKRSCLSKTLF